MLAFSAGPRARRLLMLLTVLGTPVSAAAAEPLTRTFAAEVPNALEPLNETGYRTIGVLPFALRVGDGPLKSNGSLLHEKFARWTETLLILAGENLNVLSNPSATILEELPNTSCWDAAGRRKLFGLRYALAWGDPDRKYAADAFVVGEVDVAEDWSTATVQLFAVGRDDPETLLPLHDFEVRIGRELLADAGVGFSVGDFAIPASRGFDELIQGAAVKSLKAPEALEPAPVARNQDFVELTVLYDGQSQPLSPTSTSEGMDNWQVPTPAPGERVTFELTNLLDQNVAVVLLINDRNTLYGELATDPGRMAHWVLEPGKKYRIGGLYNENQTVQPLKGLPLEEQELRKDAFGSHAGLITMYVFRQETLDTAALARLSADERKQARAKLLQALDRADLERLSDQEREQARAKLIENLFGPAPAVGFQLTPTPADDRARSRSELVRRLLDREQVVVSRALVDVSGSATDVQLEAAQTRPLSLVRHMVVRYWDPEEGRILPALSRR